MDGQSGEQVAAREQTSLHELEDSLKAGRDKPLAVRRVEISQGAGKLRPLGIPAVKDRIVQPAVKLVSEPSYERECLDRRYGFRPGRGGKDALREGDRLLTEGYPPCGGRRG